ncbi:MAG: FxDxF family PEP-CTERM protein [Leptothrix sp. (in: b-proteobacteria)]
MSISRLAAGLLCAGLALAATSARADLTQTLSAPAVSAPASIAFANGNVQSTVASTVTVAGLNYNFVDRYDFALAAGADITSIAVAFNVAAGTQSFGVSNLQLTLLDTSVSTTPLFNWLTVNTPITSTITQVSAVLPTASYPANNSYQLVVRGLVSQPGSYSGVLTASSVPAAVPLPAALPLLFAGFGALGAVARRRRPA